jgi:hypothetical protein
MIIDDDEEEEGRETRIALDQTQLLFCILRRPLLNTSELRLHFIWCFRADSLPPPTNQQEEEECAYSRILVASRVENDRRQ